MARQKMLLIKFWNVFWHFFIKNKLVAFEKQWYIRLFHIMFYMYNSGNIKISSLFIIIISIISTDSGMMKLFTVQNCMLFAVFHEPKQNKMSEVNF